MISHLPEGAKTGVIFLHGRGGSAWEGRALLDHAGLSTVALAAPQAAGQSWWPTSFLAPAARMQPPLLAALDRVEEALGLLRHFGLPPEQIWLMGFSQGACLALEAYARMGCDLAGVLAFSGGLVGQEDTGTPSPALYGHADKTFAYPGERPGRVWLSVHEQDPHIPLKRVQDSAATFRALGAKVDLRLYPGAGHAILPDDITALRQALAPTSA
ncbi:MAG: dienelactone hydrolase family protein [Cypionkella sp.]|nr:dienelactone hydrolase family protein [Cypionkella sp.]